MRKKRRHSLGAWLDEWSTGNNKETYLDVFVETGQIRGSFARTEKGTALREHLFGSRQPPSYIILQAAIEKVGMPVLVEKLQPIINSGFDAKYGAFTAALRECAVSNDIRSVLQMSHASESNVIVSPKSTRVSFSKDTYTLVPVQGFASVWNSPVCNHKGVYLWCIEYDQLLLVNYVGKTWSAGGFGGRLRTEINDYRASKYCTPVDIDAYKRGVRVELPVEMSNEQLQRELKEIVPLYRILLIPLGSDDEAKLVESTIVQTLRQTPEAFQFLCNRDKHTAYARRIELDFPSDQHRIIGLNTPVPMSLQQALS